MLHKLLTAAHQCIRETERHDSWRQSNWSGNVKWGHLQLKEPTSEDELKQVVSSAEAVRVVGSAHSFSPLVSSMITEDDVREQLVLSLRKMPRRWELDSDSRTLTVDGAMTYSEVCAGLSTTPYAIPNTASLPHFSVAGALATGTHGSSGMGADGRLLLGGLADAVTRLEIIGPDGEERVIEKEDPVFNSSVVSLGLVGVVKSVTLRLVDAFQIRQRVYGTWPPVVSDSGLSEMLASLPSALSTTTSFSAFLDWSLDSPGMLVLRDKINPGSDLKPPQPVLGGSPLQWDPVPGFLDGHDFEATSTAPWHDKLPAWMKDAKPTGPQSAAEYQIEHFVPIKHLEEALEVTRMVGETWGQGLLYCELRAVRWDSQLMSPYSFSDEPGMDALAIAHGMSSSLGLDKVLRAGQVLQEALDPMSARPHWGKLTTATPAKVREMFGQRLSGFQDVCQQVDPERKFSNSWLSSHILDA